MKGAKDDDKVVGPLFPRLHVNDADKGGPRAPPRNKMALYEQFSIPSQRFNSASSAVPLPPHNSSNLVPSLSSSQGFGHQRNMFPQFYMTSQVPVHSAEIVNSRTSDGINHIATRTDIEIKSIKEVSSGNLFGIGSVAECSSQQPHNRIVKNSGAKNSDDADDIVVPTFNQSEVLASKKDVHIRCPARLTSFNPQQTQKIPAVSNSPVQSLSTNEKTLEQTDNAGSTIRGFGRNHIGKNLKETSAIEKSNETNEKSPSLKATELSNGSKYSFARYNKGDVHFTEKSVDRNLCQENVNLGGAQTLNDNAVSSDRGEVMKARSQLFPKISSEKYHRTMNLSGNCQKEHSAKENGSLAFEDGERKDDTSEPSMVETISGLVISPDDIVEVIGPKHFWKARRAIINQQRVFAIQVFELHRLIKVQKSIAASPHLLLEGNPYLSKPPAKAPSKNLVPQCKKSQLEESRPGDIFQKQNREQPAEEFAGVPALPPCEDGFQGGQQVHVPKLVPNPGIPSSMPMAPDDKPGSPWCFPHIANQWLVPVVSPSEGLVYKPYSGPCPPSGGFMTPLYGGCTPLGVPHVAGDFMNPAYGLSPSHRTPNMSVLSGPPAMAPHYFPSPYGLRPMNPMISSSAVEQVSNLAASQANGQTGLHSGSSCNMSHHPRKESFSVHLRKLQLSKNSELQGSTASSPSEKAQPTGRSSLPPFPTAPAANSLNCPSQSSGRDSQTRVIKVVPHNARSATESAARIFRSIQEERQQHES